MGHTMPKLRMEAPTAFSVRSKTFTVNPFFARALAVASPTMPAPITIADRDDIEFRLCVVFPVNISKENGSPENQYDTCEGGDIEHTREEIHPGIMDLYYFLGHENDHRPQVSKGIGDIDKEADIATDPVGSEHAFEVKAVIGHIPQV